MIRSPRALSGQPRLMRPLALLLSASLVLTPPALADGLPDLGDAAQSELSPQMEKQVGESIINEIRLRDPQYLDDPEITAYLEQIGGRLVAASPDPAFGFTFFAMADTTINAFATFGGYVGVNTGLLMSAQTESELAGVLAHEISHVTQHHLARGIAKDKQQSTVAMIAMALALLAARNSANGAMATMAGTQAAVVQSQLAFSRDFEREADRIGFQTLQKAGFDVRGMGDFFQRLQQATRLYENNAPAYMRTHPLNTERIADMHNRAQQAPYKQIPDSLDFHLVRAKLRAQQGTPQEAQADFESLLKERKFASEAAVHYGLARAQLRGRNYAGAEREMQTLRRLKVASPLVENLAGEIRSAQGDFAGAADSFGNAIRLNPMDVEAMRGFLECCLKLKSPASALNLLKQSVDLAPQNIDFRELLGKAQLANDDPETALKTFQVVVSMDEARYEHLFDIARAFIDKEEYDRATECLDSIIPTLISRRESSAVNCPSTGCETVWPPIVTSGSRPNRPTCSAPSTSPAPSARRSWMCPRNSCSSSSSADAGEAWSNSERMAW